MTKRIQHTLQTFIPFVLTIILWSTFFGGFKFLIKNLTYEALQADPGLLLEKSVAFLSIGGFIANCIGGPISKHNSKWTIILRDALCAIALLIIHYYFARDSLFWFSFVSIVIGIFYGIFSVIKAILITIEMEKTGLKDTIVNGIAMIGFIVSLIVGAYISTALYAIGDTVAFWVFLALLVGISVLALFLRYEEYEQHEPLRTSSPRFFTEAKDIFKKRGMILIPSAFLWAIATIISIKSIPYSQELFGLSEATASLILLFSAVGAIAGNGFVMLTKEKHRWGWFRFFCYVFAILTALFHLLTQNFIWMVGYSFATGFVMGAATNLVDAYYLLYIGKHDKKESGAALQGICLNAVLASLLFGLQPLPEHMQFIIMGVLTIALGVYVRMKVHHLTD